MEGSPFGEQSTFAYKGEDKDNEAPSKGKSRLAKALSGKSKLRKRIAAATILGGGSLLGGILFFMAMIPLKIEHIISNLDQYYGAAVDDAIENSSDKLFDRYITKKVFPNLGRIQGCHTTVDASCVALGSDDSTPIGRLYNTWKQDRIEQKLARDHGLAFGRNGDNSFFMNTRAGRIDIGRGTSIFGDANTKPATRNEIRRAVRQAMREGTMWDKVYNRFVIGKLLEKKYGVKRCTIACDARDNFSSKVADKKVAAKAYVIQKVITPASESYGLILQCILGGGCSTDLDNATAGEDERRSPFRRQLDAQLAAYAARLGPEELSKLVAKSEEIGKDGFAKVAVRGAITKVVSLLTNEAAGAAAGQAAEKAVPGVGWALFIAHLVDMGAKLGPFLQYAGYAANSAAAVQMYSTYQSVTSEMKSGHMDSTMLGSFNDSLTTNLSGSKDDQVDATATPLYNALITSKDFNGGGSSLASAIFPKASAAGEYRCDDGTTVPTGKMVCPEEELARGNETATKVSEYIDSIPILPGVASGIVSTVDFLFQPFNWLVSNIPGIDTLTGWISNMLSPFIKWMGDALLSSPFSDNMSGGRTFDMLAAGADVSKNKSCQVQLGCSAISDATAYQIRSQRALDEEANFKSQPFFARMFDTSSPYSFTSRLALAMPSNILLSAREGVASLMTNPLSGLLHSFGSIFTNKSVFAASGPVKDPFGVVQYGFTNLPDDLDSFWKANCVNGPLGKYDAATKQLDVTDWLNSQEQDPNTGEAVATTSNACLLIQSTTQSLGGMSDPAMLPQDSLNPDTN
jgi:hypothetical protein